MPRLLALAIEKGYYDSPIAGVRTRIAPKWLSALPIPPKISLRPPKAPLSLGGLLEIYTGTLLFLVYKPSRQLTCRGNFFVYGPMITGL